MDEELDYDPDDLFEELGEEDLFDDDEEDEDDEEDTSELDFDRKHSAELDDLLSLGAEDLEEEVA